MIASSFPYRRWLGQIDLHMAVCETLAAKVRRGSLRAAVCVPSRASPEHPKVATKRPVRPSSRTERMRRITALLSRRPRPRPEERAAFEKRERSIFAPEPPQVTHSRHHGSSVRWESSPQHSRLLDESKMSNHARVHSTCVLWMINAIEDDNIFEIEGTQFREASNIDAILIGIRSPLMVGIDAAF
jgi:hypothetical protein